MKGKKTFTVSEIKQLEELIILRNKVEASKQKSIRDKMRKLGFYGKDDWGIIDLQVNNLNALIKSGRIKVTNGNSINPFSKPLIKEIVLTPNPISMKLVSVDNLDLGFILNNFAKNCFNPKNDIETKIDDSCGNYIICLKNNCSLPELSINLELTKFDDLEVLYTGIAGRSLRNRDFKQHFKGNAGSSTLRKSLGCLFGYKLIPRDKDPNTGKTKYSRIDEEELTKWMLSNLVMYFLPNLNYNEIESQLITHFNPPLNLKGNNNSINADFRKNLSSLRSNKNFR